MKQPKGFLCYGGGLGDVVWDYLQDSAAMHLQSLVTDYGMRVRVYTQCHNNGCSDLFLHHPYIHEHILEDWAPPSEAQSNRFREPLDGYLPIRRLDLLERIGITPGYIAQPQIYLTQSEERTLAGLLSEHPCIVIQPYAGLSDRDGFSPQSLETLVMRIIHLEPQARIIIVGKNHPRAHKYSREEVGFEHPRMVNLIDRAGIRLCYHLVARCDALCAPHSNLIRTAWDFRRRNVCVMPDPLMTRHIVQLDRKYTYGWQFPESKIYTYPFDHGQERQFNDLDTESVARFLLGRG